MPTRDELGQLFEYQLTLIVIEIGPRIRLGAVIEECRDLQRHHVASRYRRAKYPIQRRVVRVDRASVRLTFELIRSILIEQYKLRVSDLSNRIPAERRDQPSPYRQDVVAIGLTADPGGELRLELFHC